MAMAVCSALQSNIFWYRIASDMEAYDSLIESSLGYKFVDRSLLTLALTHRGSLSTPIKERPPGQPTNERLEFLGDRVLGLVISESLLKAYPYEAEGALATRLAALVSASTLSKVAEEIGLGSHIKMAPGQQALAMQSAILADACEAVIGALYLDGGLEVAAQFISSHWESLMRREIVPPKDSKTTLQEWAQGRRLPLPYYKTISESGPAHTPSFVVSVKVDGFSEHKGEGRTKRFAEQAAAALLLKEISGISK